MIKSNQENISVLRQCKLLSISRSTYYYKPKGESIENLKLDEDNINKFAGDFKKGFKQLHKLKDGFTNKLININFTDELYKNYLCIKYL